MLIDSTAYAHVDHVRAEDFYTPYLRTIWNAICELAQANTPVDINVVSEHLERKGLLKDVGGYAAIATLAKNTPGSANVRAYADTVLEKTRLRALEVAGVAIGDCTYGELAAKLRPLLADAEPPPAPPEPFAVEMACTWATRPAPASRDWVIKGLIPAKRLTSFLGDGGLGKSIIALQIAVHVAASHSLFGLEVGGGAVLAVFCEDEQEELQRRLIDICAAEELELSALDRLGILCRDGEENVLATFENDRMVLLNAYHRLEASVAQARPRLLILDTLADFYGGKYLETTHIRQFTKTALGGLCRRYECAVLLIAHPSSNGIESGRGDGFSTAWNNSVRSRFYLRRPKSSDREAVQDRRVLELKKANYGPSDLSVPLIWQCGAFAPDPNPLEETAAKAPKVDTELAVAARDYFLEKASDGSVISFGAVHEALKSSPALPEGKPESVRKALGRALSELVKAGTLLATKVPRGYRLASSEGP